MTTTEIETRLSALERKVELLAGKGASSVNKNWILELWGSFAGDDDFVKAMELGRKWRAAENRKSLRAPKSSRTRKPRK